MDDIFWAFSQNAQGPDSTISEIKGSLNTLDGFSWQRKRPGLSWNDGGGELAVRLAFVAASVSRTPPEN